MLPLRSRHSVFIPTDGSPLRLVVCSLVTNFSAAQLALIAAVSAAAKGPVIAMVFSGGAMDVSPLLANPKASPACEPRRSRSR